MINKKIDEISAKLETIKVLVQDNEYLNNVEKSCKAVNKRNQILENRIQKAIEYITNNFADIDYIKQVYGEEVVDEDETTIDLKNIKELLDILKGKDNG